MSTLQWIALGPAQKPHRIGLYNVHTQNADFMAVSVTERSCTASILKVNCHLSDRFLCLSLWQCEQVFEP